MIFQVIANQYLVISFHFFDKPHNLVCSFRSTNVFMLDVQKADSFLVGASIRRGKGKV